MFGPDADGAIHRFVFVFIDWVDEGELLVVGGFEEDFLGLFGVDADEGMAAGGEDFAIDFKKEGKAGRGAVDADKLTFFDGDAVVDQDVGEFFQAWVAHEEHCIGRG